MLRSPLHPRVRVSLPSLHRCLCASLCAVFLGGMALWPVCPLTGPGAALAASAAPVPPEVRQAAEDIANLFRDSLPLPASLELLSQANVRYDAEITAPTRYLLDCRRGRGLSVLLGIYRADAAYAQAFSQPSRIPLREGVERLNLTPEVVDALESGWGMQSSPQSTTRVAGERARQGLQQAARSLKDMPDVQIFMDMLIGVLLENMHILTKSIVQLAPDADTGVALVPAMADLSRRVDAYRRILLGWTEQPELVRQLGLHNEITMLDRMQANLELLQNQPSRALVQQLMEQVDEFRGDLMVLCDKPPPPPEVERGAGGIWQLYERKDMFKPRNFF